MKVLSIYLIIIFSVGCSPQKRLNRLIKKYPELTEVSIDTIKVRDTIYIENYDTTVLSSIIKHDTTIIVNNDRTFARYYYDTLRQEIFHEIECIGDTIHYYKEVPYKVEKVVFKELSWWQKYKDIIIIISLLILALVILKKAGKILT
ncbi:hypothetical protein CMI47_10920 [Candidatus Pacearchaeota archaeon]|nr:hypothetical protein [Candidatus Pacearchaeota archaeon]